MGPEEKEPQVCAGRNKDPCGHQPGRATPWVHRKGQSCFRSSWRPWGAKAPPALTRVQPVAMRPGQTVSMSCMQSREGLEVPRSASGPAARAGLMLEPERKSSCAGSGGKGTIVLGLRPAPVRLTPGWPQEGKRHGRGPPGPEGLPLLPIGAGGAPGRTQ